MEHKIDSQRITMKKPSSPSNIIMRSQLIWLLFFSGASWSTSFASDQRRYTFSRSLPHSITTTNAHNTPSRWNSNSKKNKNNGLLGGKTEKSIKNENCDHRDGSSATTKLLSSSASSSRLFSMAGGATEDIGKKVEKKPMHILFLSSDTGGGHRASAEALGKQFVLQYPGSTYELADVWTDYGCLPYRTIVNTYKFYSSHPRWWRAFYYASNNKLNQMCTYFHSNLICGRKIKKRIASINPDVIVSVHPTMNFSPWKQAKILSKELGKHIPFYTVVTDLGSGHRMWFTKWVEKIYLASDKLHREARRKAKAPEDMIVRTGLPIRHDFAVQAEQLKDRNADVGKKYQKEVRKALEINPDKQVVLVMGGGEGVGSLSKIVDELYAELKTRGVDATVCVVCGRNEKLKQSLDTRDWDSVAEEINRKKSKGKLRKRTRLFNFFFRRAKRSRMIEESLKKAEENTKDRGEGNIDVVGLGFVTNMAEYMAAADILVTKAGPGTIAEAASVGLPLMLTSFLPGQEAGNVDLVLEDGFGDYCEDPSEIAHDVASWLTDPGLLKGMSQAAYKAGNPYAADEIVQDIGDETLSWMEKNNER